MDKSSVLPPGEHSFDPYLKDIDPVGFALQRLQCYLTWIEEHRTSFEKVRTSDPVEAEKELADLADSTKEATRYFVRLGELLLSGYTFDPTKRLPNGLFEAQWLLRAQRLIDSPDVRSSCKSEVGAPA
jgi:hypothetical protein